MPIQATEASVFNGTYDLWAFEFRTIGDGCTDYGSTVPAMPIRAQAMMVKARVRDDGTWERSPLSSDRVMVTIDDLAAAIGADPTGPMAQAYASLVAAVSAFAASQGKL